MSERLTDEQLRRVREYVHPDEATNYVCDWLHGMAEELAELRDGVSATRDAALAELDSAVFRRDEAATLASELAKVATWFQEYGDEWRRRAVEAEKAERDVNSTITRSGRVIAELKAQLKHVDQGVVDMVRPLIDREPCDFDHAGGCQAHGYLGLEPGELCPQEEAKRWLAAHTPREEDSDGE